MNDLLVSPNPHSFDLLNMCDNVSSPIHHSEPQPTCIETNHNDENTQKSEPTENSTENSKDPVENGSKKNGNSSSNGAKSSARNSRKEKSNKEYNIVRRERPSRACTVRAAQAKLYVEQPVIERKRVPKKVKVQKIEEEEEDEPKEQCSKIVTPLLNEPPPGQLQRWNLRSMWELASILNFFNVFRPLVNIKVEFTAEELETALLNPNSTLGDVHIPLLKAIPPVTRMACGRDTWVTVLCRKLKDWWFWVAEGEVPIVASHGAEVEAYKLLDPSVRVKILKALCDIRVEQEDIRRYIDSSIKHGAHLSVFRKERVAGDSQGIFYWYEDDPVIGHRLYREIRKVEVKEVKRGKAKGSHIHPSTTYEWQAVATNLDEFQDVSEKLFTSKNRTEVSLGKKLKNDMLPEIEKEHKRRERLIKKQQRQALLLDNCVAMDGLGGRSLRDRKPVTYTFDDFDRSINEAIKITKNKQPSPEPPFRREHGTRAEPPMNGSWSDPFHAPQDLSFSAPSPTNYDESDEDSEPPQPLDRSNRRRQRPRRYSEKEYVEEFSEYEREDSSDSDDDIVGEAVYDDDYVSKRRKRKRLSSSSEGDDEYQWSDENVEEEEEDDDDDMLSMSEDSDKPRKSKKLPDRSRRQSKSRSVDELQTGLRRSRRSTRNRINYGQYDLSESDTESAKRGKDNADFQNSDSSAQVEEYSMGSQEDHSEREEEDSDQEGQLHQHPVGVDQPPVDGDYCPDTSNMVEKEQEGQPVPAAEVHSPSSCQDEGNEVGKRRFLDLNELAPGSGFEDGPSALMKDEQDEGSS